MTIKSEIVGFAVRPQEKEKIINEAQEKDVSISELCRQKVLKGLQAYRSNKNNLSSENVKENFLS
ncbi:MAG: hypothetical protein JXB50_14370 [Spirochaetes bacterium]|nr:hypothetical protein [Spirochaetota bacterium]